jgi:hypothetical protein
MCFPSLFPSPPRSGVGGTEPGACAAQRLDEFMAGFGVITMRLKEMYQMITLGGDAELELVDSLDPFSEGIVFRRAAPPRLHITPPRTPPRVNSLDNV